MHESSWGIRAVLQRSKPAVDLDLSDRELFDGLPLSDPWEDAHMLECVEYLFEHKCTAIPASWENSMQRFRTELRGMIRVSETAWQSYMQSQSAN